MSDTYTLDEEQEQQISDLLLGHRIVAAETGKFERTNRWGYTDDSATGRITLDDGTQILVTPNDGGCICGAGDYALKHLATVDNIITSVRVAKEQEEDEWGEGDTRYRIFVVADAVEINAMSVEGNDGNGYYGTGYELTVIPASASGVL